MSLADLSQVTSKELVTDFIDDFGGAFIEVTFNDDNEIHAVAVSNSRGDELVSFQGEEIWDDLKGAIAELVKPLPGVSQAVSYP